MGSLALVCGGLGQETAPGAVAWGDQKVHKSWQPVQEYLTIVTPSGAGRQSREHTVNPFLSYTHLGTDFGFVGPAAEHIGWTPGMVWVQLPEEPDGWAGMWHSLERLGRLPGATLDFTRVYPEWIRPAFQPRVTAVRVRVKGHGDLKLEIKGPDQETLWQHVFRVRAGELTALEQPLPPESLRRAKWLNWIAEPGADLLIDSLGFEVEEPAVSPAERLFAVSYAKASRCFSPETGLVRDRAQIEDGAFDSLPATGLFLLATAAAADLGVVDRAFARAALERSLATAAELRGPYGLLPHFARRTEGRYHIHPGTEYSTVDTAIYYHGALLAARVLREEALERRVLEAMRAVDFAPLRDEEGYVTHGFKDDGVTRLVYRWRDWGGETALVLLLQALASNGALPARMAPDGRVHQGTGFIAEIQSLFFPDFSQSRPDALTGVDWLASRRRLYQDQQNYFRLAQPPEGFARKHGLFGLSAGEGAFGIGYHVGGCDLPEQTLIHPHYMVMAACLEPEPAEALARFARLEALQLLPPWGLVENVFADGSEHLPLIAGLNAGFEAVGAYHFLQHVQGGTNAIYEAALTSPELRRAMRIFYPDESARR